MKDCYITKEECVEIAEHLHLKVIDISQRFDLDYDTCLTELRLEDNNSDISFVVILNRAVISVNQASYYFDFYMKKFGYDKADKNKYETINEY